MQHEIGYWWVTVGTGQEIVYWTGSEAQRFGTDGILREREIDEWISYEGKAPRSKATIDARVREMVEGWLGLHYRAPGDDSREPVENDSSEGYRAKLAEARHTEAVLWSFINRMREAIGDPYMPLCVMPSALAEVMERTKGKGWAAHLKVIADRRKQIKEAGAETDLKNRGGVPRPRQRGRDLVDNVVERDVVGPVVGPTGVDRKKQIYGATMDCEGVPPGYKVVEDYEDEGTYQARRDPWAGEWTTDKDEAAHDAWDDFRSFAEPLIREATEKAEMRWKWLVEDAQRARDRLECEHGTWARLTTEEQMRVAEDLRDTAFSAWRGQLLADGRWFGLEHAAQTLAEAMDKRRARITRMPIEKDANRAGLCEAVRIPCHWEWGTTSEILSLTSASNACTRGLIRRATVDGVKIAVEVIYLDVDRVGHWHRWDEGREHEIDADAVRALVTMGSPRAEGHALDRNETTEDRWRPGKSKGGVR